MNETIIRFLQEQTCATICCINERGEPYCFSCFYAFNREEGLLCFKSSADSHHSVLMKKNPCVAGTVLPDKLNTLLVKGLQFEAIVLDQQNPILKKALVSYIKRHPMALAIPGEVWALRINSIKMTDSTKIFGKKIVWKRDEALIKMN